jgi:ribulose-5-phosphate 4-epimerase/fuculose-1-phosphate aldolase
VHDDEKPRLVKSLGNKRALILRNHGLLCAGKTIADAFDLHYRLQRACEVQLATAAIDEGIELSRKVIDSFQAVRNDDMNLKMDAPVKPNTQRLFDSMVRLIDKKDQSYKY